MKTTVKTKATRAAKRDLFAELSEGMAALAEARHGKARQAHAAFTRRQKQIGAVGYSEGVDSRA